MTFDHGYALLVGVGKCRAPEWSLPVTVQDMQALRRILVDPNLCAYPDNDTHVRLLHDKGATAKAILDGLAWLKERAAADKEATVVVFFSGHGILDQSDLNYYLVPHDYEPGKAAQSALPANKFTEAIGAIRARRLLVFIDSCHAEALAKAKGGSDKLDDFTSVAPPQPVIAELKQGEGRAVFTSSRGAERSWVRKDGKLSVYTYHLIEAFQGAGNKAGDNLVHVSNLMGHVRNTVPASARTMFDAKQTPFFDTDMDDFPVAILRGGKGLPAGGWDAVAAEEKKTLASIVKNIKINKPTAGNRGIAVGRDLNAGIVNTGEIYGRLERPQPGRGRKASPKRTRRPKKP